jgi:hypothetical protein
MWKMAVLQQGQGQGQGSLGSLVGQSIAQQPQQIGCRVGIGQRFLLAQHTDADQPHQCHVERLLTQRPALVERFLDAGDITPDDQFRHGQRVDHHLNGRLAAGAILCLHQLLRDDGLDRRCQILQQRAAALQRPLMILCKAW